MDDSDFIVARLLESFQWASKVVSWQASELITSLSDARWKKLDEVSYKNVARQTFKTSEGALCDVYFQGHSVTRVVFRTVERMPALGQSFDNTHHEYRMLSSTFSQAIQVLESRFGHPQFTGNCDCAGFPSHLPLDVASSWLLTHCTFTAGVGQEAESTPLVLSAVVEPITSTNQV